ncbi:MAG: hypothetical protein LBV12_03400 [Puniceicoccales bacterium]|nr:hypothetical protein [Puniceicoccales bacterium]
MAVFAGWGIGSISSYLSPRTELVESVFAVLWFCIGWLYMFAWCLIAAGVIVWVKIACKLLAKASARLEAFSKNVYSS